MIPSFNSDRLYNFLKFVALVLLPAVATFYLTVGQIWGLPNAEQVVATLTAVSTGLGAILTGSSRQHQKELEEAKRADLEASVDGDLYVTEIDGQQVLALGLNTLEDVTTKDVVKLQVEKKTEQK